MGKHQDPRALLINPNGNNARWHSDITCEPRPPSCSVVQCKAVPSTRHVDGSTKGDTQFASMYRVYELLSPGLRELLHTLSGVHVERRAGRKNYVSVDTTFLFLCACCFRLRFG